MEKMPTAQYKLTYKCTGLLTVPVKLFFPSVPKYIRTCCLNECSFLSRTDLSHFWIIFPDATLVALRNYVQGTFEINLSEEPLSLLPKISKLQRTVYGALSLYASGYACWVLFIISFYL